MKVCYFGIEIITFVLDWRQNRSTEGCSKLKSPETRQVRERLVSILEHLQVPNWDRTSANWSKLSMDKYNRCTCTRTWTGMLFLSRLEQRLINSASYDYKLTSDTSETQILPIGIPAGKTFPQKNNENIVYQEFKHLHDVSFTVFSFHIKMFLQTSWLNTKYLFLRLTFLTMKEYRIVEKKNKIWLSRMTKAPIPTEISKTNWQHKTPPNPSIIQRLRTDLGR